eukprot:m.664037 g.664037  ORF g.664037 m.664037 type:complete len:532 (-) comp58489_c0_seq1:100-1695(-)
MAAKSPASARRFTLGLTAQYSFPGKTEKGAVVLTFGSACTLCGFAGEHTPRHVLPTPPQISDGSTGHELRACLTEFLSAIWFQHMLVKAHERRVFVLDSITTPTHFRSALTDVLITHFQVVSVQFVNAHVLATLPLCMPTCLVVDCGHSETSIIAVSHGIPLLKSYTSLGLGGAAVRARIEELLMRSGRAYVGSKLVPVASALQSPLTQATLEDIAVRACVVSGGKHSGITETKAAAVMYRLADGTVLELDSSIRQHAYDVLFDESAEDSIAVAVAQCLLESNRDIRRELARNILLIGGTSQAVGFKFRLQRELTALSKTAKYASLGLSGTRVKLVVKSETTAELTEEDLAALEVFTAQQLGIDADKLTKPEITHDRRSHRFTLVSLATAAPTRSVSVPPTTELPNKRKLVIEAFEAVENTDAFGFVEHSFGPQWLSWVGGSIFASIDFGTETGIPRENYHTGSSLPDWCVLTAPAVEPPIAASPIAAPSITIGEAGALAGTRTHFKHERPREWGLGAIWNAMPTLNLVPK